MAQDDPFLRSEAILRVSAVTRGLLNGRTMKCWRRSTY
jgi:hypothetical protein